MDIPSRDQGAIARKNRCGNWSAFDSVNTNGAVFVQIGTQSGMVRLVAACTT